ncbi:hypothetical protein [Citricoccus muralis]|uniref:Uncharacterized protein n=1 Tax=Citricoccus muralis TaxID=169134 RepID=A0ABY8H646_9MICC|nr:hypothetical protein [Citricoccus muralis]WFP16609.1 hypothetical protein P8192_00320 [Citricoccus muralis]
MKILGWYFYFLTEHPKDPWELVRKEHYQPAVKPAEATSEDRGAPALYDFAFSAEDGNGIQQGWAGRSRR